MGRERIFGTAERDGLSFEKPRVVLPQLQKGTIFPEKIVRIGRMTAPLRPMTSSRLTDDVIGFLIMVSLGFGSALCDVVDEHSRASEHLWYAVAVLLPSGTRKRKRKRERARARE